MLKRTQESGLDVLLHRVLSAFKEWLARDAMAFFDQMDVPDFWGKTEQYAPAFGRVPFTEEDMRPFTATERRAIGQSIADFRTRLLEHFETTAEQLAEIDKRLDYPTEAVDRLNRFDWKGLALSTLISIGVNLSVDTAGDRRLLTLFQQAFAAAVKLLA